MTIFGISLILFFGIINLLLIIFQIGTGKRWLKVNLSVHRTAGVVLFFTAIIHAVMAFLAR